MTYHPPRPRPRNQPPVPWAGLLWRALLGCALCGMAWSGILIVVDPHWLWLTLFCAFLAIVSGYGTQQHPL